MTGGCRQTRTQRVELVMQALLGHLAVDHQPTAMTHRRTQRLDRRLLLDRRPPPWRAR
jgi:hypothetical protein